MERSAKIVVVVATLLLVSLAGLFLYNRIMQESITLKMDAVRIMTKHGFNCFRLRLFVNPLLRDDWGGFTGNNLSYTIALAKRIKATGSKFLLNFHYSDTWADPEHQTKPTAWKDLNFDALEEKVYEYTRECISTLKQEGVLPDMVQPGNEIAGGMLWPDGKLYGVGEPEEQWEKFTRLLKAVVQGVEDAAEDENVQIALHAECGGNWEQTQWFFENIEKREVPYDVIALSYYPWWHGSTEDLQENLHNTAMLFGKDILVVETAYPYRALDVSSMGGAVSTHMRWPMTPEGQKSFLNEIVQIVWETPNGRGLGVLWWFPESIPVQGLSVWNGGATALFDQDGNVLPAMDVFKLLHEEQDTREFITGGDISALAGIEDAGGVFRDAGDA